MDQKRSARIAYFRQVFFLPQPRRGWGKGEGDRSRITASDIKREGDFISRHSNCIWSMETLKASNRCVGPVSTELFLRDTLSNIPSFSHE